MAASRRLKPTSDDVVFAPRDDGALDAVWPVRRQRFLLSNGTTVDVVTDRDDSTLRAALLRHVTGQGIVDGDVAIVGVADLGPA